uniref:DC1 domain-containing protein n=2 Tax=Solanum lycopersicum TaxID=4081 RepID=A0A3Q7HYI5_SOLLC
MAPIPTTIQHFTHKHSLILHHDTINPKYLCEGCMTYGFGTRYHCHACTSNLHEDCAKCPRILWSFMHPHHPLRLVERDHQSGDRACNICRELIEGLSYRCEPCGFDVHPICTLLPETLNHILHQPHPLRLLSSIEQGITCVICRGACNAFSWRYRCALCNFDIHIRCVPIQCQNKTTHRGISTYFPPSILPQQHYFVGYPNPNNFPGPSNMNHYNNNIVPQLYQQNHGQAQTHYGVNYGGRINQVMFHLVKTIATGVISNLVFGVIDVSTIF